MKKSTQLTLRISSSVLLILMMSLQIASSHEFDLRGVNFKANRPRTGDSLQEAVAQPEPDSMQILQNGANTFIRYPLLKAKVVGFTDMAECEGQACIRLSLRRAIYVRNWLINHGVRPDQLLGPEGHGSDEAIDNNGTEIGRARNRHVELQITSTAEESFRIVHP